MVQKTLWLTLNWDSIPAEHDDNDDEAEWSEEGTSQELDNHFGLIKMNRDDSLDVYSNHIPQSRTGEYNLICAYHQEGARSQQRLQY